MPSSVQVIKQLHLLSSMASIKILHLYCLSMGTQLCNLEPRMSMNFSWAKQTLIHSTIMTSKCFKICFKDLTLIWDMPLSNIKCSSKIWLHLQCLSYPSHILLVKTKYRRINPSRYHMMLLKVATWGYSPWWIRHKPPCIIRANTFRMACLLLVNHLVKVNLIIYITIAAL